MESNMKKSLKITLIVLGVLVGVIILDTLQAKIFESKNKKVESTKPATKESKSKVTKVQPKKETSKTTKKEQIKEKTKTTKTKKTAKK